MSVLNTANNQDILLANGLGAANGTAQVCGGMWAIYVWGTVSGTAKLQVSPDNGTTWIDYPGASFTGAAGTFAPVYLGSLQQCRLTNSAGTVNATLCPIP